MLLDNHDFITKMQDRLPSSIPPAASIRGITRRMHSMTTGKRMQFGAWANQACATLLK